jgi:hypothetical protein
MATALRAQDEIEPASRSRSAVDDPMHVFPHNFNRVNFVFRHALAGHPLFALDSLIELARRLPDHGDHYWANGPVAVHNSWSEGMLGRQSLEDTIANIEHNNSTVVLRHTEQDPPYGAVLQEILARIIELGGERMRKDVALSEVQILVSSPGRITPYHMNPETGFILQIKGDKSFHIFDQTDRTLVSEREREDFFAISRNFAVYRPERQKECNKYELRAGFGVHVPSCAPHWVQNRSGVSVALSLNYSLRSVDRLAKLYRFNRRLRALGLDPAPPQPHGRGWRDRLKLAAEDGLMGVRTALKGRPARRTGTGTAPQGF